MAKFRPRRLLLVKLGSIGDVVNTLPLVNALKNLWPGLQLAWLVEPKSLPVIEDHPAVDEVIVFQRDLGLAGLRRALAEIRLFRPEIVLDLQRIIRSGFFTFFSGCRLRLGFDRKRCKEASWLFCNLKIPPNDPHRHMALQYLEFASYFGLSTEKIEFLLPVGESERSRAAHFLPPAALKSEILCLNLGASKPANRWPWEHWASLAEMIAERNEALVVLTGGKEDQAVGSKILSRSRTPEKMINLAGRTSLKELGGLYSLAAGVVSSDSGPMHIASALETRTVGLFGPSNPARTGPWNYLSEVVRSDVSCSPCGKKNCRRDECMRAIAPEAVFKRLFTPFAGAGE